MIKYARVIDKKGVCDVGLGTNTDFYKSIGMSELDVELSDVDNQWYLKEKCPHKTEEEKEREERERINHLSMTKREMFLGLYQAKGITPDMLKAQISDPQALIEFEYANDYYRGNGLIDKIGGQLGFTTEQLDKFFETKDYTYLIPAEEHDSEAVETPVDNTGDNIIESKEETTEENSVVDEVTDEDTTAE